MCKENSYAKTEKSGAQISRCTGQGLTVMPCVEMYCVMVCYDFSALGHSIRSKVEITIKDRSAKINEDELFRFNN